MAETYKTSRCARWGDFSKLQQRVGQDIAVAQERAGIPHMGGASGPPRTCKGLFTLITQTLNIDGTDPEE